MIIFRYLQKVLQEHLLAGKVNLIFGTRRVGKTYDQQEIDWIEVENQEIRAYEMKWTLPSRVKAPQSLYQSLS